MKNFKKVLLFSLVVIKTISAQYIENERWHIHLYIKDHSFDVDSLIITKKLLCESNRIDIDKILAESELIKEGDEYWQLTTKALEILNHHISKRTIKLDNKEINFNHVFLKNYIFKKPSYVLYFLSKQYPYWKVEKTPIRLFANYIKIELDEKDSTKGEIKKIVYDSKK